jgi:hypothetical protein
MKFKNLKKKHCKNKLPSNSRINPEDSRSFLPKISSTRLLKLCGGILKLFVALIFAISVIIVSYDFQNNLQIKQDVDLQRENVSSQLSFWENFISQQQNYPDAYFQASILEYRLGNMFKAKMYAEKGLSLDPNSENGKKIEQLLK